VLIANESWRPPRLAAGDRIRRAAVVYRFSGFALDTGTRQLVSSDGELHVSPKAFELLTMLLANAPRVVAKVDIQERLWPATFVQETNIASLVAEIRRALRTPDRAGFIRTVYRFGYRFVGDVTADTDPPRPPTSQMTLCLLIDRREIFLAEGASVVGRSRDVAIQIDSPGVSRTHSRIVVSSGDATIDDLGSKNGTYLNGTRITAPTALSDGDEIRIGPVIATFRAASAIVATVTVSCFPVRPPTGKSP
jgi:DNA-binding winged helix-turn-helix (wHTH) protein